jgi:23S rRNA pseudouridine2605 synthase
MLQRLQKILAHAGVASRRKAEALILAGQVEVNGQVVTELGRKADPERDQIRVAGRPLRLSRKKVYLLLHKPPGVVATLFDPQHRPCLQNLLRGVPVRVFPVGRLEYNAAGSLLLTNDGEWAAEILGALHRGLSQTYQFKLKGRLTQEEIEKVGAVAGSIRLIRSGDNPWYEVVIHGARRDRLRRLFWRMDHCVEKTRRVAIGPLNLGKLPAGRWRYLTNEEVRALRQAARQLGAPQRGMLRPGRSKRGGQPTTAG